MFIVLDTNILFSDFHLRGAEIESVCKSIDKIGGKVCIPEVVMRETVNKYKEELTKNRKIIDNGLNGIARVIQQQVPCNPITETYVDEEVAKFETNFRRRVKELHIDVLPVPSISHDEVIARDLARRKPFTSEGKGYRDTLIWESILILCKRAKDPIDKPIAVLINKNFKDFCEDDTYKLHPDLKNDLMTKGLREDCVRVVPAISVVMKDYIKPTQQLLQAVVDQFNNNKFYNEIDLNDEVAARTTRFLENRTFDSEDNPLRWEFDNPTITDVELVDYKVVDVRVLTEENVQVDLSAKCRCSFDFYIYKADAALLDEDEMPEIIDADWNRHYMAACKVQTLSLSISLIVDSGFTAVQSESISID